MDTLANTIIYGNLTDVKQFIERQKPDLSEMDEYGYNALVEAGIVNKTDIGLYLLQCGAPVNLADATGRTALHWTVENNNLDFTRLLLQQNANPNQFNLGSQPCLVNPLLRKQKPLVNLLIEHGADLHFAKDYIQTKMLGHMYNLQGVVDIVSADNTFIELSFEGYFLEFTLYAIHDALDSFIHHYSAKPLRQYFGYLQPILRSIANAAELIRYQQYTIDRKPFEDKLHHMLNRDLLLLPMAYEGHAISFIKFHDIWCRCDRGEYGRKNGCINIYRLNDARRISSNFLYKLIYTKHSREFITEQLDQLLQLTSEGQIPIAPQISGNCSWANIEASIPTMLYLLFKYDDAFLTVSDDELKERALSVYEAWLTWYQDKTLNDFIHGFADSSPARKASKAAVLGAILMQQCRFEDLRNISRVNQILKILMIPEYRYVLRSYLKAYTEPRLTPGGKNLKELLDNCGIDHEKLI